MKFIIKRASGLPVGDGYKVLKALDDNYAIIEINNLDELPEEEFILGWHVSAWVETMAQDPDLAGTITLYDSYVE